jgi:hypothetical protein
VLDHGTGGEPERDDDAGRDERHPGTASIGDPACRQQRDQAAEHERRGRVPHHAFGKP